MAPSARTRATWIVAALALGLGLGAAGLADVRVLVLLLHAATTSRDEPRLAAPVPSSQFPGAPRPRYPLTVLPPRTSR